MNQGPVLYVSRPGTSPGPCGMDCMHGDCAQQRKQANSICRHCRKRIGYDQSHRPDGDGYRHAGCGEPSDD